MKVICQTAADLGKAMPKTTNESATEKQKRREIRLARMLADAKEEEDKSEIQQAKAAAKEVSDTYAVPTYMQASKIKDILMKIKTASDERADKS